MKKTIILWFILTATLSSMAQIDRYRALLDSAKLEFKKEFDQQDYANAIELLTRAIKTDSKKAEAHYFLGYAYSRLNSKDGKGMIEMNLELTQKSSEQFELVNKLEPNYGGEYVILDPYSKITAEWGSMAMSYWHNNNPDSARWAFAEGKRRGGFSDFILKINRAMLDECSKNAILISSGDNFTIPLWYLQIMEKYRGDISVIDISLLNTIWYPAYLEKNNIVSFDLPKNELDSIEFTPWQDSIVTIHDFSWVLKPSYYERYLLRGDLVFLSLLRKNNFNRPLYFSTAFYEEARLSLKDYLSNYPLVDKLTLDKKEIQPIEEYKTQIDTILGLYKIMNQNSRDEKNLFEGSRFTILNKISNLLNSDEIQSAKAVFDILNDFTTKNKAPFEDKNGNEYLNYLEKALKNE